MKKTVITAISLLMLSATVSYGDIYTWKDGRGISHYTNSIHEIPARYLKKARVLDVATGKLGGLAINQPAQKVATGPAAQPGQTPQPGAAATPMGAPAPPPATEPIAAPVAAASPAAAVPPQSNIKLPPPTPEAQRKINRMRARYRDRSSGEQ